MSGDGKEPRKMLAWAWHDQMYVELTSRGDPDVIPNAVFLLLKRGVISGKGRRIYTSPGSAMADYEQALAASRKGAE